MDKHYDPKTIEAKWYPWWEQNGFFTPPADNAAEPYCIVIPPPNVTGILHMGHALNNTLQDVLTRWRRMQGRRALWVPGTDHAGIATQNVVEKALRKEGVTRHDLGREAFVGRVWQWKKEYGGTIVRQLRRLGTSCDWTRERFTMDDGLSDAVAEVFCRLYDEGLVYRGKRIVNWCPRCGTALSDEESEHQPNNGSLWHIRYPLACGKSLTVATTRPETLLGDTALAVNPADERYKHLVGRRALVPVLNREIPIVADDYVDAAFGTGVVKITPAHDPNDFEVAQRHNLPFLNVMDSDATMNAEAGPYAGLDRFACRKKLVADLDAAGLLEKVEPYQNAVGHCTRCDTIVESRLSDQWFVRMKPLAEPAIEAVKSGAITFHPKRYEQTYFHWMENIRDWCISRQLWWGHRVPVYTCRPCGHEWAATETPKICPTCGAKAHAITQDEDVLDTWFSSWLWPFSTLGWPEKTEDLKTFYPTTDLVTAADIIFFWVARMIMAGCKFMGEPPFKNVVFNGLVRDSQGRKMSKSLNNSIDPLESIEQYGADALRFTLMTLSSPGVDMQIATTQFEIGRNFGTKIWNAARFILVRSEELGVRSLTSNNQFLTPNSSLLIPNSSLLTDDDRHLLLRCDETVRDMTAHLEAFRFQDAARLIQDFIWTEICDHHLEAVKPGLASGDPARVRHIFGVLGHALGTALRLLHPIMPFITEELWHALGFATDNETLMAAPWPQPLDDATRAAWGLSRDICDFTDARRELVTAGRAMRAANNLPPGQALRYILHTQDAQKLAPHLDALTLQLRASEIEIVTDAPTQAMPVTLCKLGTLMLPLEGLVDVAAERAKLDAEIKKNQGFLSGIEAKLNNPGFTDKAPAAVVENQRQRMAELRQILAELAARRAALG
ncbi:MAG: valine--tRNA ligase [Kiritimatiellaeota bacterium]|nr:valine--tRNA ligase [Kiritimatiellota bacterium]